MGNVFVVLIIPERGSAATSHTDLQFTHNTLTFSFACLCRHSPIRIHLTHSVMIFPSEGLHMDSLFVLLFSNHLPVVYLVVILSVFVYIPYFSRPAPISFSRSFFSSPLRPLCI